MPEPTPQAMKAAEAVYRLIFRKRKPGEIVTKNELLAQGARIIDSETGLPKMRAALERSKRALRYLRGTYLGCERTETNDSAYAKSVMDEIDAALATDS